MRFILFLSFLFLISCSSDNSATQPTLIEINEIASEQQIPKQLLAELDAELAEEFKSTAPFYSFIPITVQFEELQLGVLTRPKLQYNFPKGGGAIDLKNVVAAEGSFFMSFPEIQFNDEHDLLHIFFISNSPKTIIQGETFGLGCGKWNDLKQSFSKLKQHDYLKVNTNNLRYLRVLAGTYIFILRQGKNIFLTQLTLTDSRHSNELCGGT
jgi:hypothetical protein